MDNKLKITFELPKESLLMTKQDLKEVLGEMIDEVKSEMDNNAIMTIKETANYLKVSVPTVRSLIGNKEIPFFQKGQVIRINRSHLVEWLRNNSQ
jgi:excisionase family DNA binding protein